MASSPEFNSFEHPSFERMWAGFEWVKEPLPELREATPEEIQKSKEHNTLANRLYQQNSITEALLRSNFEEGFNKNLDTIWRTGEITDYSWDKEKSPHIQPKEILKEPEVITFSEKPQMKIEKQLKSPDTPEEKEKLTTYAELSDLAYVDFVSVPDPKDLTKTTERISSVRLDPLSFPNLKMITEGRMPEKPTEDERIIIAYLDKHKSNDRNNPTEQWILRARNDREIAPDISQILRVTSLWSKQYNGKPQYASLDGKYQQTTMIDVNPNLPPVSKTPNTEIMTAKDFRIVDAMEYLRTVRAEQASKTLETITKEKGYTIVDYFPNEIKKDKTSSGFGAICLEDKEGNISFAIRWTDVIAWIIPEPRDAAADAKLALWQVPENQTKDLIAFFERNLTNLKEGQKVNITGHSLGGALTQIASIMYAERVGESYTFNSPWAKKLAINPEGKSEIIRQKFEKFKVFEYNRGNEASVENRMTNVSGIKWPSIISNLGEDIGYYEILLKKLESHSIAKTVEYIENDATNEELQRHYVWPDKKEKKKEREKYN